MLSYLWDFVVAQYIGYKDRRFRIRSPNDSNQILLDITPIVGDEPFHGEEKNQSVLVSHLCIDITIIDMEPKAHVWQNLGVVIDFLHCKDQGKKMLVVLWCCTKRSLI